MTRKLLVFALLFCFLSAVSPSCYAAEITDQELTRLSQIFNQLQTNLETQNKELATAKEQLQKSNEQITLLQKQLTEAQTSINQAQNSLEKVNKSFDQYSKETQREINSLKIQRAALVVILGAVLLFK